MQGTENRKIIYLLILLGAVFIAGLLIPSPIYRFTHGLSASDIGNTVFLVKDTAGMYLPDGGVYEGTINALTDLPEGYGALKKAEESYVGAWRDGRLVFGKYSNDTASYEGQFNASMRFDGFGIYQYSASYVDRLRHRGVSESKIPVMYAGNWRNGVFEGLGRCIMADSTMSFGHYSAGKLSIPVGQKFKPGQKVYGIDISHYQRSILWDRLALRCDSTGNVYRNLSPQKKYIQPVIFAFIKATDGSKARDITYPSKELAAKRHAIIHGAYHFLRYDSSGEAQAKNFLSWAHWAPGDLPPVLDVENEDEIITCGEKKFLEIVFSWLELVEKEWGVRPIIYCTDRVRTKYIAKDTRYSHYDYWIARYSAKPPTTPGWKFWQFSSTGRADGVEGNLDLDLYFSDYKSLLKFLPKP